MKLNETYDIASNAGILVELGSLITWLADDSANLNYDYYLNRSGEKEVSPLFEKLYENDSTGYISTLAKIIYAKFYDNWNRLYAAFIETEYNPIDNYSMTEEGTDTNANTRTNDLKKTSTNNSSGTDTTKVQSDFTNTQTTENGVQTYGFNSSSAINQNDSSGTVTTNTTGSADNNVSTTSHETTGEDTTADTGTVKDDGTTTHKLTRIGNIGVTTSQQMIQSEIDLRRWSLIERIYTDIDSILTLSYYGGR